MVVAWLVGITSLIISAYLAHNKTIIFHSKEGVVVVVGAADDTTIIIAAVEREVANGWHIDLKAKPATLTDTDRSRYAHYSRVRLTEISTFRVW